MAPERASTAPRRLQQGPSHVEHAPRREEPKTERASQVLERRPVPKRTATINLSLFTAGLDTRAEQWARDLNELAPETKKKVYEGLCKKIVKGELCDDKHALREIMNGYAECEVVWCHNFSVLAMQRLQERGSKLGKGKTPKSGLVEPVFD